MNQFSNELPPPPPVRNASTQQYTIRVSDPDYGNVSQRSTDKYASNITNQSKYSGGNDNMAKSYDKALPEPPVKEKSKKSFKVFSKKSKKCFHIMYRIRCISSPFLMILNDLSKHFFVVECFITFVLSKGIAIGNLTFSVNNFVHRAHLEHTKVCTFKLYRILPCFRL